MKKIKIYYRIFFGISLLALIIGACFHGLRIHPEDIEKYNIGITVGIVMAIVFAIFFLAALIMRIYYKKKYYSR